MEMLERCPGCSVAREAEPKKAEFVSSPRRSRPCAHCGYDGPFPPAEPDRSAPRDSLPSFAGARAKLATATQDLFRLSGNHSIPVKASVSEPPAPPPPPDPPPVSSSRKAEASIMFSLEALMKANQAPPKADPASDEASSQLWSMQSAEPLFGTAHDQALLTTPLKMEPAQSMDSMILPSEAPNVRRWWPIALAASVGLALAAAGLWLFGSGAASLTSTPASEQAALEAQPPAEPPPVLPEPPPAPAEPVAAVAAPVEPADDSVPAPSAEPADEAEVAASSAPDESASDEEEDEAEEKEARKERPRARAKAKPRSRAKPRARAARPRSTAASPFKAATAFDKSAARSALNAAATHAASCGAGGAPGKGKIQVTFEPSGKASNVQLVGSTFAGTTAGRCAVRHFRLAKIPAFKGSPVTVAKSFTIY